MESPSRLVSRVGPAARCAPPPPRPEDCGGHSELDLARITRKNVLLVGPEDRVEDLVDFLVMEAVSGATIPHGNAGWTVPEASGRFERVVVRDVDTLTTSEQQRMLAWLGSNSSRAQVVSTASAPLLPLVESGAFNDALYYRLNTVYIDLTE